MKKSLINPVIHEIRNVNPPKTRFPIINSTNTFDNYQNSIDGMAGVGYNRDSNKLRQLQQDASSIATGARPNPEKNEKRFMGLFGNDVFNEPQKTMSSEDLQMRQNLEMLRHGNANRRFGKSNSVKKSSYENGIAGAGYSGEIIVTPKKGRPYKGQPDSLPLVSKRQKIKKDDNSNPNPQPGFFDDPLTILATIGGGLEEIATSPLMVAQFASVLGEALHKPESVGKVKRLAQFIAQKKFPRAVLNVLKDAVPLSDLYARYDLLSHAASATGKEIGMNINGSLPSVDYGSVQSGGNEYTRNYNSYGDAATSNFGTLPSDLDIWGLGKYITPPLRWALDETPTNLISEAWNYNFNPNYTPREDKLANFSDLPYHRQLEEQLYGRPIETRRRPDLQEIIRQAILEPYSGQMIYPKGKDLNSFDFNPLTEIQNVFGDVGSNYGMQEGVLSDVSGWTKGGQRRKTNIYREQPPGFNRQSLVPYSTDPYHTYSQTKNDAKLMHGLGGMFVDKNPFYSEKNANDYTVEDEYDTNVMNPNKEDVMNPNKEWMTGARLTNYGPYASVNQTAYWKPEKTWGESISDWYNSMFNNNQSQYNQNLLVTPTTPPTMQPTIMPKKSKWKSIPTTTPTPVTKSLITNKNKYDADEKSLNFAKSLNSTSNKYDTTSENQILSRNKYLK